MGSRENSAFEETARSDDTIELIDRSRDVGLRVHATQGELRLPGATVWQPWATGKWIGIDELPKSIRFVPTDWKIRLVYFVPKDRTPIDRYEEKIRVVMRLVADVYADLKTDGHRSAQLALESNSQGAPIIHLVRGDKQAYLRLSDGQQRLLKEISLVHYQMALALMSKESWPELWHTVHLELALLFRKYTQSPGDENAGLSDDHYKIAFDLDQEQWPELYGFLRTNYDLYLRLFDLEAELRAKLAEAPKSFEGDDT